MMIDMMYVDTFANIYIYITPSNVVVSDLGGLLHNIERDLKVEKGVVYYSDRRKPRTSVFLNK